MDRRIRGFAIDWPTLVFGLSTIAVVVASHLYLPQQPSPLAIKFAHSLHAPGFAIIAATAWLLFRRQVDSPSAFFWAAVVSTIAAILGEASQIPGPRTAQLGTIGTDMIGVLAALTSIAVLDPAVRRSVSQRWWLALPPLALLALFLTLRDSISIGAALIGRSHSAPQLLSFEHAWESRLYTASQGGPSSIIANPDGWPQGGGNSILKVEAAGRWNVALRLYPDPDWSGHDRLAFLAASADGKSHALTVSVSDTPTTPNSESNRRFAHTTVYPKPRRFVIRLDQLAPGDNSDPLDFRHVNEVILTTDYQDAPTTLLLDDFRLE